MEMTQSKIVAKLLEKYNSALEDIIAQPNVEEAFYAALAHNVGNGVCQAMASFADNSSEMLHNYNSMSTIIKKYSDDGKWWGEKPYHCKTKYEIVSCIEYRIMILETILETEALI